MFLTHGGGCERKSVFSKVGEINLKPFCTLLALCPHQPYESGVYQLSSKLHHHRQYSHRHQQPSNILFGLQSDGCLSLVKSSGIVFSAGATPTLRAWPPPCSRSATLASALLNFCTSNVVFQCFHSTIILSSAPVILAIRFVRYVFEYLQTLIAFDSGTHAFFHS